MDRVNSAVRWVCGMGLVIIALAALARFVVDYQAAQQRIEGASGNR